MRRSLDPPILDELFESFEIAFHPTRNHALHAGATEILEKPFSITTLREVLDRHLI
jgi:hypothetical protein